ncbi:hypothetical protein JXA40_07390 [bacterium]|nr:hypothetical protein [candidate division CSSED10-310 bacterium]
MKRAGLVSIVAIMGMILPVLIAEGIFRYRHRDDPITLEWVPGPLLWVNPVGILEDPSHTGGIPTFFNSERHRVRCPGLTDYDAEILLLGASNLFGYHLPYADTPQHMIERLTGHRVMNASVIGYTSQQGRLALERLLTSGRFRNLKIALVQFGINDVSHWGGRPPVPVLSLNSFSRVGGSLCGKWISAAGKRCRTYRPRVTPAEFKRNVQAILDISRRHGLRVILIPDTVACYKQLKYRDAFPDPEVFPEIFSMPSVIHGVKLELAAAKAWKVHEYFPATLWEVRVWLEYERCLLKLGALDINALLFDMESRSVFRPWRIQGEIYSDKCHLNPEGWHFVSSVLACNINKLFDGD